MWPLGSCLFLFATNQVAFFLPGALKKILESLRPHLDDMVQAARDMTYHSFEVSRDAADRLVRLFELISGLGDFNSKEALWHFVPWHLLKC